MNGFIADKITNLSAARYFAARGAEWLFYDPQAGNGVSLRQILAIKEWVEGPKSGLYLALGADSLDIETLENVQPEGLLLGHFGSLQGLPAGLTIFKEWCPEAGSDPANLVSWITAAALADSQLIRLDAWTIDEIRSLEPTLRALAAAHSIILSTQLAPDQWNQLVGMALPVRYCFTSPSEEQVGLLAVDDLDVMLDTLEELR